MVEIGTHDELVGRPGGVYAKLYALQAFDDRAVALAEAVGESGAEVTRE
jgi:hypothetical protein